MTTDTEGKMNAFGVQLYKGFKIEHLYCVDHRLVTAKLACHDKNVGLDVDDNPCTLNQKCKAIVGHYRSLTQAAQKSLQKALNYWDQIQSPCPGHANKMVVYV
jgi:hypothetical protein